METPSEFKDRKLRISFKFMDQDNHGAISLDDFLKFPRRLESVGKTDQANALRKGYEGFWDRLMEVKGHQDTTSIDEKDFIIATRVVNRTPWFLTEFVPMMLSAMFDSIDRNDDHRIDISEWRAFYASRGIQDDDFVQSTFNKMDSNKDGFISQEEFKYAFTQFAVGDDPMEDYSFLYAVRK